MEALQEQEQVAAKLQDKKSGPYLKPTQNGVGKAERVNSLLSKHKKKNADLRRLLAKTTRREMDRSIRVDNADLNNISRNNEKRVVLDKKRQKALRVVNKNAHEIELNAAKVDLQLKSCVARLGSKKLIHNTAVLANIDRWKTAQRLVQRELDSVTALLDRLKD